MSLKKILTLAAVTAIAAVSFSCGNSPKKLIKKGLYDCNNRLQTAVQRMEKRNFNDAIRIFEEIKFQCGGSPMMDTVYYYTAISYFRQRQFDDARVEFEALYREFPRSPFAEEAHFRVAQMRYLRSPRIQRDQAETKEAMKLFNDYFEMYPEGVFTDSAKILFASALNKVAEKEYSVATFYRKQRKHEAALIYYRSVLSTYPDSDFAPPAIVGMVEMLVQLGRVQDAGEVIEELDAAAFEERLQLRIEAVRQKLAAINS